MLTVQIEEILKKDLNFEYAADVGSLIILLLKTLRSPEIVSIVRKSVINESFKKIENLTKKKENLK